MTVDRFVQPDSVFSLGAAPRAGAWEAAGGIWGVARHRAYVAGAASEGANIAVLDLSPGPSAVEVRMAHAAQGAGLVFRYQDPQDYWAVLDVPAYATWSIIKVTKGRATGAGDTGLSPVGDGTTIGVRLLGPRIQVALGTKVVRTIVDPSLDRAGMAGLIAEGGAATAARFSDFGYRR